MRTLIRLAAAVAALCLVAVPASAAPAPVPEAAAGEPGLVGTWRLVRFENVAKDGKMTKPYGDRPRGYFIYDATGHLSINIMLDPPVPPFASGDRNKASDAEKVRAFDAYVGYFGTYRVDKANQTLHHLVEGALDTTYTDTLQKRPYRLNGDVLIIELDDPDDGTHYYRELHRVR